MVADYGAHKDVLQELLLFYSSTEKKLVTLHEYVERMKPEQKEIYYASGENVNAVDHLPQLEGLKDDGVEILYLTEEVDEFAVQILHTYQDKELRSALDSRDGEKKAESGEEEKPAEDKPEDEPHKAAFDFVKEALGDSVKEVRASHKLKSHPVCLTAGEGLSFEMEKYMNAVQPEHPVRADRILELNTNHPVFAALAKAVETEPEKAKKYASLLYDQALLIAGLPLDDPSAYTDLVCELLMK